MDDVYLPLKFKYIYFGRENKTHLSPRTEMCWLCITNAGVSGAPVPAVFLHGWLWLPFLLLHQAILGYNFSNGRCQTQWRQRQEPRVWRSCNSLVSCHQATGQRTLQEGKKRLNVGKFNRTKAQYVLLICSQATHDSFHWFYGPDSTRSLTLSPVLLILLPVGLVTTDDLLHHHHLTSELQLFRDAYCT